ncbi:hypothetical protein [Streptomyces sp. NPDC057682]|uniref:hypothetical protein n=1 Tax=Streptomyces sp. NPDC057682 TaxID=3346210 RepID=UPI0036B6307C
MTAARPSTDSAVWRLHHHDREIARLRVTGGDMPWLHGELEELPGFDAFREVFVAETRAVDEEDWERAEACHEEIRDALTLTYPDGTPVAEFLLRIHGDGTAGWRWHGTRRAQSEGGAAPADGALVAHGGKADVDTGVGTGAGTDADPGVRLVRNLVAAVPAFEDLYESHVFNEDGVLPHVFFWEVTQETVKSFLGLDADAPDWRATLRFLEEQSARGVPGIDEVVVTSFLEYLPFPGQPGHAIVGELGPVMAAAFAKVRSAG